MKKPRRIHRLILAIVLSQFLCGPIAKADCVQDLIRLLLSINQQLATQFIDYSTFAIIRRTDATHIAIFGKYSSPDAHRQLVTTAVARYGQPLTVIALGEVAIDANGRIRIANDTSGTWANFANCRIQGAQRADTNNIEALRRFPSLIADEIEFRHHPATDVQTYRPHLFDPFNIWAANGWNNIRHASSNRMTAVTGLFFLIGQGRTIDEALNLIPVGASACNFLVTFLGRIRQEALVPQSMMWQVEELSAILQALQLPASSRPADLLQRIRHSDERGDLMAIFQAYQQGRITADNMVFSPPAN